MVYNLLRARQNSMVSANLTTKKGKWQKKRKHIQSRNLRRKTKSVWVLLPSKTDEYWQEMIGRDVPERLWKKSFLMSRDAFFDLVDELHPFIVLQGNSPNYQSLTTEKRLTTWLSSCIT